MITNDEAIKWVEDEFSNLLDEPCDERAYEAVMTILATLRYSELLIDKFGSLEEALEAEKVTHCWECGIWRPDKTMGELVGICNKPCESMRYRSPGEYCSDGRYYRKTDEKLKERLAEISDLFARENILSAEEIKAALERSKEEEC